MKKTLFGLAMVMVICIAAFTLGFVNGQHETALTDEEKVAQYIISEHTEYADSDVEIEIADSDALDGDGIEYLAFVGGKLKYAGYVDRAHMESTINK